MQHYVGLDVSVKETSVCIVDKAVPQWRALPFLVGGHDQVLRAA